MRARSRSLAAAAGLTSLTLLVAACGGGDGETSGPDNQPEGQSGGDIIVSGCTPQEPLIPGNTSETCGGDVLDVITSTLVHYDTETAEPSNDIAESIETEDSQTFTITLKQGYLFHDGTEVQAHNFVDAWNYAANCENGYAGSYFMSPFAGSEDVGVGAGEGECAPTSDTMSGLEVVDDYTFTATTSEPTSNLPIRLGYSAFAPMPDVFFDDPEAFGDNPVGSGPYELTSQSGTEIVTTKFADYAGEFEGQPDSITYRIYQDLAAGYTDVVAGTLDVVDDIPPDQLIEDLYQSDLPDRNSQREIGGFRAIVFSPNDEQLADNVELRMALSMAIDRESITDAVLSGADTAATGWVSPSVDGYAADACGEACVFDAAAAQAMYEAAGGYEGTLVYNTNTDNAVNQPLGEAICNSITNTLGVACQVNPIVDFATYLTGIDNDEYDGMLRSGWQADYPSIENFLAPIYGAGADSNWSDYNNPEFQQLLSDAAAATDVEDANALYQEAERLLAVDLPSAPFSYRNATIGWSERVTNVEINPFGQPDYTQVQILG